jgi:hypothetical protein
MLDVQGPASSAELQAIEAETVIGEHAAGVDAEVPEPLRGTMQEALFRLRLCSAAAARSLSQPSTARLQRTSRPRHVIRA